MEIHPLLEDLAKWSNEENFYSERYFWWYGFRGFNGEEWVKQNLEKDIHKQPVSSIDFRTGQPIHEIGTFMFSHDLKLKIQGEFKELRLSIQEKVISLETQNQQEGFTSLIIEQLKLVFADVKELEIPELYYKLIIAEISIGIDLIEDLYKSETEVVNSIWCFEYLNDDAENRKKNIHYFLEELSNNGLIERTKENRASFKKFINNKKPKDFIIWNGSKAELVSLFKVLINKDYIQSENHWVAVSSCFKISKKGREYHTMGLKSEKGSQDSKKIERINAIIQNLEE